MEVPTEAVRGRTPQKEVEMNRTYEIMFIVRPDVEEAELDKLIETFSGYITTGGGTVKTTEKMGRRRLAYTVKKFNDGFYVLLIVEAPASLISEIERRLRVSEPVIKFLTVRMDEEDKRVAKIKAHRDAHVKRSAQPQVNLEAAAEVAAPVAEAPAAPVAAASVPAASETAEVAAPVAEAEPAVAS
jgi:small subunit ribosomal protein S6